MGNTESVALDSTEQTRVPQPNKFFFEDKYNLVPSFPGYEYKYLDLTSLKRRFNIEEQLPKYIDLRPSFPPIVDMNVLPFNGIYSVVYLLHYQLLKNNLPVFPPSAMYLYKNLCYYKQVRSIYSYESIFNAIKENGLCSESELPTRPDSLEVEIQGKVMEKANAFKFIDVYRIDNNLETVKTLLNNKYPIIIGFSVYYDMATVESYMWLPDEKIDKKLGGLGGVLVGYIEDRKMFIMATTFGQGYGTNGYILIPYDYVTNQALTFELYTLDFIKERVEGYINQRKEIVQLQSNKQLRVENKKNYSQDGFSGLFK